MYFNHREIRNYYIIIIFADGYFGTNVHRPVWEIGLHDLPGKKEIKLDLVLGSFNFRLCQTAVLKGIYNEIEIMTLCIDIWIILIVKWFF